MASGNSKTPIRRKGEPMMSKDESELAERNVSVTKTNNKGPVMQKRWHFFACTLAATLSWLSTTQAAGPPFSIQDVPKDGGGIVLDGKVGAGEWNGTKLEMSWTHGQTRDGGDDGDVIPCEVSGACNGTPLGVTIQYAWDDTNFYFLVEETTKDDDPTKGITAADWCHQCTNADATETESAPWSTDSVGFYNNGIKWTKGSDVGESYDVFEMGPLTQVWVGLTAAEDLVIDGKPQYRHITRTTTPEFGEAGAQLIGPEHEPLNSYIEDVETRWDLTSPQSAFGVTADGRRVAEMYMRWDQMLYDADDPDPLVQERLATLEDLNPGVKQLITTAAVKEGYEFRLDPLLVDGTDDFSFGGQTHPEGNLHPAKSITDEYFEVSVVRLTGASTSNKADVNRDGNVDAADIDAISTAVRAGNTGAQFDVNGNGSVNNDDRLHWVGTLKKTYLGDSNLDGQFNSGDFVFVFAVGEYEDSTAGNSGWGEGDWNGDADFNSGDFVAAFAEGGYELGPRPAVSAVPEPATLGLIVAGSLLFVLRRRRN